MKRLAVVVLAGLALSVAVAAAQALKAPERVPVARIELPATVARSSDAAGPNPSIRKTTPKAEIRTATPKAEIRPAATRRQATVKHVVNVVRREPRAPARTQSLPARLTSGGGDDGDDDDHDDVDD